MTNRLSVSFPVPCKAVIVVKQKVLPSVKTAGDGTVLPNPNHGPNARLVHVEIVGRRPFKGPQNRRC